MNQATLSTVILVLSTLGLTVLMKDFVNSIVAGLVVRRVKHIRPKRRIKILGAHTIKGDVISIGPIRTTLAEVGDGEHLPSILTGRQIKMLNTTLLESMVVIYEDDIVDEVIALVPVATADVDFELQNMRDSIVAVGHELVEVGLFQKDDRLIVHGVFRVKTDQIADERTKVLGEFLKRRKAAGKVDDAKIPAMYLKEAETQVEAQMHESEAQRLANL